MPIEIQTATRKRALVIGYGSPIRGDDAVGPLVADRLQEVLPSDSATVLSRHVLTAELVGEVANADLVVFLDAATDGVIGEVLCHRLQAEAENPSAMAHFLQPSELLAWTRYLYQHEPTAYLVTVRGESFEFSHYELTPAVAAAVPTMIDRVRQLIAETPQPRIDVDSSPTTP